MNLKKHVSDILLVPGLAIILTIFITHPGFSQDTTKVNGDNKVRIVTKIIEDQNGKMNEFDTVINLDHNLRHGEEKGMFRDFEMRIKDLDNQMKDLEVELNDMKFPDSLMNDSAQQWGERDFRFGGGEGNNNLKHHFNPGNFNFDYNFEMPESFKSQQGFFRDFSNENRQGVFNNSHQNRLKGEDESLNDVLGDIPMNSVKSYSIKDTKDGKRIIIELNKEPFIEHRTKVIILHSPRPERMYRRDHTPQIKKRVIIKSDQKDEGDQNKL